MGGGLACNGPLPEMGPQTTNGMKKYLKNSLEAVDSVRGLSDLKFVNGSDSSGLQKGLVSGYRGSVSSEGRGEREDRRDSLSLIPGM